MFDRLCEPKVALCNVGTYAALPLLWYTGSGVVGWFGLLRTEWSNHACARATYMRLVTYLLRIAAMPPQNAVLHREKDRAYIYAKTKGVPKRRRI